MHAIEGKSLFDTGKKDKGGSKFILLLWFSLGFMKLVEVLQHHHIRHNDAIVFQQARAYHQKFRVRDYKSCAKSVCKKPKVFI